MRFHSPHSARFAAVGGFVSYKGYFVSQMGHFVEDKITFDVMST
jgi:hypothetical protein